LIDAETPMTLKNLTEFSRVPVESTEPRYRLPLEQTARELACQAPRCEFILLGSIGTKRYAEVLLPFFGERLRFPSEFVGRGDMSRGGLMLRCVAEGRELTYISVSGAVRRGQRPPRLQPRRSTRPKAAKGGPEEPEVQEHRSRYFKL